MNSDTGSFRIVARPHGVLRRDISATHIRVTPTSPSTSGAGYEAAYLEAVAEVIAREEVVADITFAPPVNTRPVWLDEIYSLVAKSRPDAAVDMLFNHFDAMFSRSEFDRCDGVLRAIDLSRLDTNLMVALLSITHPASAYLSARQELLRSVEKELRQLAPERADRLLRGLR